LGVVEFCAWAGCVGVDPAAMLAEINTRWARAAPEGGPKRIPG
jgi:hypothetical protein